MASHPLTFVSPRASRDGVKNLLLHTTLDLSNSTISHLTNLVRFGPGSGKRGDGIYLMD